MTALSALRPPLWLASSSPRRLRMLQEFGVPLHVQPSGIDDGRLTPGRVTPAQWVMALAYLKARAALELIASSERVMRGCVLGGDTVCVARGRILGQPATAAEARAMLHALRNRTHQTITGVCLIDLESRARFMFADRAHVTIGELSDEEVELYVASGEWRGKAGAYNLRDRQDAGWPIECAGDPDTVMGLPMKRLMPWLDSLRSDGK